MVDCFAVLLEILSSEWNWSNAVFADIDGFAGIFVQVVGDVLLTRSVGDSRVERVLVDSRRVTSVAGSAGLTVDDCLSGESNGRGLGEIVVLEVHDVESVSEG